MKINIRRARREDVPFIGWVMYTAARSHLYECPWSKIFEENEETTRKLLEHISQTPVFHWCHVAKFWIAEVDGALAAAMCGFTPATEGSSALADAALNVAAAMLAYSDRRISQVGDRLRVAVSGLPEDLPETWGVENVAVVPRYQGKGLVDTLFEQVLDEGREMGFKRAQVLCLVGNVRAQRTWERNGFLVRKQKLSAAFEALIGAPGARLLVRDL